MSSPLAAPANLARRRVKARIFRTICMALTWLCLVLLAVLLVHATREGLPWLDWQFLTEFPSRFPDRAGIKSALFGTLWLISFTVRESSSWMESSGTWFCWTSIATAASTT